MRKILLGIAIVYTLLLTVVSLMKIVFPVNAGIQHTDKIGHFVAYFLFTVIWFVYYIFQDSKERVSLYKKLLQVFLGGFFFGLLMEACQMLFTTSRQGDWLDVLANTSGIIFASLVMYLTQKQIKKIKVFIENLCV